MNENYYEDFVVGQTFKAGTLTVDAGEIKRFAAEYDPQPYHLDDEAAQQSFFKGLAASGWHTACMTMRILVDGPIKPAGGLIGAGVEELRWPLPVRADDVLHIESEVLSMRTSHSRPDLGLVKVRTITYNQDNAMVQTHTANLMVKRRPQ